MSTTRNTIPELSDQPGRLFRRSAFLTGEMRAYFGPGQRPYMIGTLDPQFNPGGDWSVGTPALKDQYRPPTDWPRAGQLLRPPQVVLMEIRIGAAGATGTGYDPYVHQWEDFGTDPASFAYETQPNLGRAEHLRLAPIFDMVKARVETLRPGRTFVGVADWCQEWNVSTERYLDLASPSVTSWDGKIDGHYTAVNENFGGGSGAGFVEAPAYDGAYLGTDFLSVYVGDSVIQNIYMNRGFGTSDPSFPIDGSIAPSDLAANGFWNAVYQGRLKPALKKFAGYAGRLFHPPDAYRLWSQKNAPPFPADDTSNVGNGALKTWQATKVNFELAASIALGDNIDITHVGESSMIIDSDYLVKLIAAHYGFSPTTGKDL